MNLPSDGLSTATSSGPADPPPRLPAPGETVAGRFRVSRMLGTGTTAAVFAATDLDLDTEVALKLFFAHPTDAHRLERLRREVSAGHGAARPRCSRG